MAQSLQPAIIIPAYERPNCLKRLLVSITEAEFLETDIPFVFSIEGDADPEVLRIAEKFIWNYGPKRIIQRENRMGLRKHILACGDLSREYNSIIVLEDDLRVAPGFYQFAKKALQSNMETKNISGVSLYSYRVSECRFLPFLPLDDGNEVYFQQFASSWGQAWTGEQWQDFRNWYRENEHISEDEKLPQFLREWSETSWKRHFIRYMLAENKYFVFPRESYSTNFGDPGTNSDTPGLFQVPLSAKTRDFLFVSFEESAVIYDVYFEPLPEVLKSGNLQLTEFEFDVDLYGQRDPDFLTKPFVLTSRKGEGAQLAFGLEMMPISANPYHNVAGDELRLIPTEKLDPTPRPLHFYFYQYRSNQEFMYRDLIEKKANVLAEEWAEERSEHKAIEKAYPIAEKMAVEKAKVLAEEIAEQKAAKRFAEWNETQEFGLKWPKISIVVPETPPHLEEWELGLRAMDYPHLELIFVENRSHEDELLDTKGRRVARFINGKETKGWSRLKIGLDAASGELVGWLPPGCSFQEKGLIAVAQIVRRFPEVSWLMGRSHTDKRNHVYRRWIRERYLPAKMDRLDDFRQPATMLWKRELMLKAFATQEVKGLYDLFGAFFELDFQYVYTGTLGTKWVNPEGDYYGLKTKYDSVVSLAKRIWNGIFYPFFMMDLKVLRAFYPEGNAVPDVIKQDSKSEDYYRAKY